MALYRFFPQYVRYHRHSAVENATQLISNRHSPRLDGSIRKAQQSLRKDRRLLPPSTVSLQSKNRPRRQEVNESAVSCSARFIRPRSKGAEETYAWSGLRGCPKPEAPQILRPVRRGKIDGDYVLYFAQWKRSAVGSGYEKCYTQMNLFHSFWRPCFGQVANRREISPQPFPTSHGSTGLSVDSSTPTCSLL